MNCAQYYMFAIKLPSPIDKRFPYLANKKIYALNRYKGRDIC